MIIGKYPNLRLRRNRKNDWSRRLVQENTLSTSDLIWPIFIRDGKNIKEPIKDMPGVYRYSLDNIEKLIEKAILLKIPMVALFPYTPNQKKNSKGSRYSKLSLFQKPDVKFFKPCPLSGKNAPDIDYKNIKLLKKYISDSGRILPSRVTSVSLKKQKELSQSIKRARLLALI